MRYNRNMEKMKLAIIGGGAAGLFLGCALENTQGVTLFERGERLGKKLSATGNGQGNVTNLALSKTDYFSVATEESGTPEKVKNILRTFDEQSLMRFFSSLGVLLSADERGRVYPTGRQASSLTDALRFSVEERGIETRLQTQIVAIEKAEKGFFLDGISNGEKTRYFAEKVVLCAGGKAAKNFGTDGNGYALCQGLGHSVSPLYPSLVQLKTDVKYTKTLKGIRINDGILRAKTPKGEFSVQGDIIFTDYGISGDAVFRISALLAAEIPSGKCEVRIDFLPDCDEATIERGIQAKKRAFPALADSEMLFGIVNNQVGRAILRRAEGDWRKAVGLVKNFTLPVTGSLGFDYAQVTKGGIPLAEVTDGLESMKAKGLYFAGEILDVDGPCGGFNLQWAYSSARTVAKNLSK